MNQSVHRVLGQPGICEHGVQCIGRFILSLIPSNSPYRLLAESHVVFDALYVVAPPQCPTRHRHRLLHLIGCHVERLQLTEFQGNSGILHRLACRVIQWVVQLETVQRLRQELGLGGRAITAVKETVAEGVQLWVTKGGKRCLLDFLWQSAKKLVKNVNVKS